MRSAAALALASLLLASCAATSAEWRTEEVLAPRGEPAFAPPLRKNPLVLRVPNKDELAQLELDLLRFGSNRKSLAEHLAGAPDWPPPMQALWIDLLSRLEEAFRPGAPSPTRRILVQARVATEVERDLTERKFGPVPDEVKERLDKLYVFISYQMQRTEPKTFTIVGAQLSWPVAPVVVTSPYGYRHDPMNDQVRFHSGVDLGGSRGDVIIASAAGRVVHAAWLGGYGRAVIIQHTEGYQTLYGHLGEIMVSQGDAIDSGAPLGLMGSSGRSTGPHLHFEVRQNGQAVDPQELMSAALLSQYP